MTTLAERLHAALTERKKLAEERGEAERISQAGLARACDVKPASVSDWFSGETKTIEGANLMCASAYLDVEPRWLVSGKGVKGLGAKPSSQPVAQQATGATPNGYLRMRLFGEAAAGAGRDPDGFDEVVLQIDVLEAWLRQSFRCNPALLRLMTARGQSMSGVANDGDVLFVLPCVKFDDDGVYVISHEGLVRVKRLNLRMQDGLLSIESTDGRPPEVVPLTAVGTTLIIQGRVMGAWGLRQL